MPGGDVLQLVAVADDGSSLLLRRPGSAEELRLPVDERLHAAVRGDLARLGQLRLDVTPQLRPREIQARVRAGEDVERVAAAAGVGLERVLPYARPVLAEREHVAERARRSPLRRTSGAPPEQPLEESLAEQLRPSGVDPEAVEWDAWRREDGRWAVVASWTAGERAGRARWVFDVAGRSVSPDDDSARRLAGEAPPARPRRSAPVPPARLAVVGEPSLDELLAPDASAQAAPPSAPQSAPGPLADQDRDEDRPDVAVTRPLPAVEPAHPVETVEPAAPRRRRTRSGDAPRPSIPSWDEIVFGRRPERPAAGA